MRTAVAPLLVTLRQEAAVRKEGGEGGGAVKGGEGSEEGGSEEGGQ